MWDENTISLTSLDENGDEVAVDLTSVGTGEHRLVELESLSGRLLAAKGRGESVIDVLRQEIILGLGDILVETRTDPNTGLTNFEPLIATSSLAALKADLNSSQAATREEARRRLAEESRKVPLTLSNDGIQFDLLIGDNILRETFDLTFDAAVPGLGLEINGSPQVTVSMDYMFGFGFGFSLNDFFYIDTTGATPTGEEFSLDLSVTVTDDPANPAEFGASLGFVNLDIVDIPFNDPNDDGVPSGLFGSFDIDIESDSGRLGLRNLSTFEIEATLSASANVDLAAELALGDDAKFPKIVTAFHYDQLFAEVELEPGDIDFDFGEAPRIVFENVSLDLGTFISDFARTRT